MAKGKSRGKSVRKARRSAITNQEEAFDKVPHTFVFYQGTVGRSVLRLMLDMRHLFEPYTAADLRARKSNSLRDFISVAGPMNVHFFIIFTKTTNGVYMKIARVPHGPTLTFRVTRYSLAADVLSALRKYNVQPSLFCQPPLLILNGLSGDDAAIRSGTESASAEPTKDGEEQSDAPAKRPSAMHFSLVTTLLQNVFAPLNVNRIKLDNVTRVAMFNYEPETNLFQFRHYRVKAVPLGLSKPIRKLLKKNVPDLSRFADVADYVDRGASYQTTSESEAELLHDEDAHVVLPTKMAGRGNEASHKSAIRLFDIGPRMTLQLVKIEEGLCGGSVLFHGFFEKTQAQLDENARRRREKQRLKQQRKQQQEANVRRKQGKKRVRFNDGDDEAAAEDSDYDADADGDDDADAKSNDRRSAKQFARAGSKRTIRDRESNDRQSEAHSGKPMRHKVQINSRRMPKFRIKS